jgi:hypothetical protein
MNPNNGNFNIGGKGIVAVLVLAVLGGGFVAFNMIQNNNNPQITNENTSSGGSVGDINVNPNINPTIGNQTQQQQTGSSGSQSANGVSPDSDRSGKASSETPIVDVQTNKPVEWSFKFPVYRKENDKCTLAGKESATVIQDKGSLRQGSETNGYGFTQITGTVKASGKADLSLKGNEFILSFESTEVKGGSGSSETIITGKATAPNCPEDKFELSKGS